MSSHKHKKHHKVIVHVISDSESSHSESEFEDETQRSPVNPIKPPRGRPRKSRNISPISDFRKQFSYVPQTPQKQSETKTVPVASGSEKESSLLTSPRKTKKKKKKKKQKESQQIAPQPQLPITPKSATKTTGKANYKSNLTTLKDNAPESARDELVLSSSRKPFKQSKQPKKQSKEDVRLRGIVETLKEANAALASIGDAPDIAEYLEGKTNKDSEGIELLRQECFKVSNATKLVMMQGNDRAVEDVPSTINHYDQYFIYRQTGRIAMVLRPVEVFHGNIRYDRKKVIGLVSHKGSSYPLMCALPGYLPGADPHPKLLDNTIWLEAVKHLAERASHTFRKYSYDLYHNKDPGDGFASHCEPKLMLWFAVSHFQKLMKEQKGQDLDIMEAVTELHRLKWMLRNQEKNLEIDVALSRPPCTPCLGFQALLEEYTDIKYNIVVSKNLAQVFETKNKQGQISFPLHAMEAEEPIQGTRIQIEIPSASSSVMAQSTTSKKTTPKTPPNTLAKTPAKTPKNVPAMTPAMARTLTVRTKSKTTTQSTVEEWCESDFRPSKSFSSHARSHATWLQKRNEPKKRSKEDDHSPVSASKKQKR